MEMLYHINGLCPRTDIQLSRCNFSISLFPAWKTAVSLSKLNDDLVGTAVLRLSRPWLDACGFGQMYDPSEDPMDKWQSNKLGKPRKLSKHARKLYDEHSIRVAWGEWGPEHITVPGNACGLDLDNGFGAPRGGRVLAPHNIDNTDQVILLLSIFTWFADGFVLDAQMREHESLAPNAG